MKVTLEIHPTEIEGDFSTVSGLELRCPRCGHVVEVYGDHSASAVRGAVIMREECPLGENNYYEADW